MNLSNWIRWGGLAAMLGGVAYVAENLVFLATREHGAHAHGGHAHEASLQEPLVLAAYLLTAAGLTGFHLLQKESYGRIGRAGFYTAIAGSLAAVFAVAIILAGGAEIDWLHGGGALIMVIGYVLYGAATLQAKVLPRWSGVVFILVGPVGIAVPGDYTTMVLGVVWLALGCVLWTRKSAMAQQPAHVS